RGARGPWRGAERRRSGRGEASALGRRRPAEERLLAHVEQPLAGQRRLAVFALEDDVLLGDVAAGGMGADLADLDAGAERRADRQRRDEAQAVEAVVERMVDVDAGEAGDGLA